MELDSELRISEEARHISRWSVIPTIVKRHVAALNGLVERLHLYHEHAC